MAGLLSESSREDGSFFGGCLSILLMLAAAFALGLMATGFCLLAHDIHDANTARLGASK